MKKLLILLYVLMLPAATLSDALADDSKIVKNVNGECINADKIIQKSGLKPKSVAVHGPIDKDAADIGCAYRQHPKSGTKVKKGKHCHLSLLVGGWLNRTLHVRDCAGGAG